MSNQLPTPSDLQQTYERIRAILNDARSRAYRAINTAMVTAYWEIGRAIVEQEPGPAASRVRYVPSETAFQATKC